MNQLYRVVFNAVSGVWQAVSEIARGRSKSSRSAKRARSSALPVMSAGVLLSLALGGASAYAACTPGAPVNGVTVTCSGTDQRNFSSAASSLTVNVSYSDQVGSDGSGNPVMQLTGSNNRINNQGWINPSYIGQQTVLTTGLQVGNAFTQNISITNYTNARLSGTSANLGASLLDLKGMAVDAQAGAGGKVTIVNSGTIQSERILGASVLVADMPVMAVYGGAQVEMTNMNDIYGRVAFQASSQGNIFTNTGTVAGSLSLGAGGGNNRFNAVTGSSVVSGGASSTDSVTVDSNSNLVFVKPGVIDGGAGASNTLALQNAIGGGSGTAGSGSVSAANFINFSNLLVQAGSWTVSGALLTGTTSTALTGGSLSVNNDAVFGSGDVSINNATLTTHVGTVNLANNILIGTAGMTTTGINTLTLNGVVSGGATGTLIKNGSGTLRINGANTYAGGTTLNAGTVVVSTNQAFGTGGIAIGATGGRLDASGSVSLANNISLTGYGTFGGTGNLTLTGIISNITSRGISKVGSGQLILTNANTYQDGTTLSAGTLSVGNNLALGSGDLRVTGASTLTSTQSVTLNNKTVLAANLTVGGSNDITLNNIVSGGATAKLIKTGSGNLTLSGANTFQGGIELNGGTLTAPVDNAALGSGALTVTGNGRLVYGTSLMGLTPIIINSGSTLEFSNNGTVIYNAQMSGGGDLVKTGTGSLELLIASTLTGLVDVRQGTVKSAVSNALGNNPNLNIDSGALVTIDFGAGLKSLTGAGLITVNSGPLTIGNSNASSSFDGVISGPGAVIKAGTGLLTLTGISTHTGTTTVNGGRLNLASGSRLTSNLVTVASGATLGGSGTLTGGVTINNGGHLALASGNKLTTGALTLSSGSILDIALGTPTVATPMASVNGNLVINASPTFNFTDAGDMANGIYRLFDYTGTLTYTGGTLGTVPTGILSGEITLDISQSNIVNVVVNSAMLARQYWDGGGTYGNGVINGGTGVWNSVENNWTKANGNSIDGWNGVSAVFKGTAGLVIIEGTQTASSLLFSTSGYTLSTASGGLLSLVNTSGGSATISTDTGVSTLIDAQIGGPGKLEKTGAGTLILAGNNLHTGGTALTAGTLIVRSNTAVGTGTLGLGGGTFFGTDTTAVQLTNAVVLNSVANIVVGSGADLTLTGVVSGAGGLVKVGAGSLVLSGNNAQLGNTWLNAGGLVLGSNSALGLGTLNTLNNTTLDSGLAGVQIGNDVAMSGNLTFLGSRDMSLTGTVSGTGNLIKNGASVLSLAGANTLNGSVSLNQGTLRLANNNALGNANLVVGGVSALQAAANITVSNAVALGGELTVSGSNDLTLSGVVSGASGLLKDGTGKLTLSGANLYQSPTTLNAGTLVLGNAQALGLSRLDVNGTGALETSSALTVGNDVTISGALTVQGSNNLTLDGSITGMGSLTKAGSGTLTLNGGNGFYGVYNVNGGRLISNTAITLGQPSAINVASGATLQLAAGAATGQLNGAGNVQLDAGEFRVDAGTFSGALSGNGDLYKNSSGTLQLSGNSSLAGATTVAGGILRVNGSLGNGSVSVQNGASLTGSGTLGGAVTVANGGHLSLASGSVLNLGSLVLNDLSNFDVALGTATPGAAGLANVSGNLTLDGKLNITDAGGFGIGVYRLFDHNGTLTDNGLQLGVLPTGISANELEVQTSVANQINLVAGGPDYLRFWDGSELTGNGTVEGGNGTWSSTNSNWTTINAGFNGAWNSSFAVFQGAAGTVVVDGTQSVTGLQFMTDGYQLVGGGADSLQLVNGISGYSTLRVDNGVTATLDVSLGGSGVLNKMDSGTLVLNGANTYSGGTTLTAGTLVLGNNAALGTGALTTAAGTTLDASTASTVSNSVNLLDNLTIGGNASLGLSGTISGAGGLIKNGTADLILTGNNQFVGNTQLNAGRLVLGNAGALSQGSLIANAGSTLDASTALTVGNAVTLNGAMSVDGTSDLTLSGVLDGAGGLVKKGAANLTLSGVNTYQGGTTLNAGTLTLASAAALSSGDLTVSGLSSLDTSSAMSLANNVQLLSALSLGGTNDLTLNGVIGGSDRLIKNGAGRLTLNGANNFAGGVTLNNGNLTLGNAGTLGTGTLSVTGTSQLNTTSVLTVANNVDVGGALTVAANIDLTLGGSITGMGSLTKAGSGTLQLSGNSSLAGATTVAAGILQVNGSLGNGSVSVEDGASLTGSGTLGGAVTVASGGHLDLAQGQTLSTGNLTLDANSSLDASLGAPVSGGGTALLQVNGNLALNGAKLNINNVGGFGIGVYSLINYTGAMSGSGLTLATVPTGFAASDLQVQTSMAHQINLLVKAPVTPGGNNGGGTPSTPEPTTPIVFWNGGKTNPDGTIGGGSGTWGPDTSWSNASGTQVVSAGAGAFPVFGGTAGVITVLGTQPFTGMQFMTSGYGLVAGTGGQLQLNNGADGSTPLRVDPGVTATLDVPLTGTGMLDKRDSGTLVLNGANTFTGGTVLQGGTLVAGNDRALGTGGLSVTGAGTLSSNQSVNLGNGVMLQFALTVGGSNDLQLSGVVQGTGAITKQGSGALILTGANTFSGGIALKQGSIYLGNAQGLGSGTLAMDDGSAIVLTANGMTIANNIHMTGSNDPIIDTLAHDNTWAGSITGAGFLTKLGSGALTLTSTANRYTGATDVAQGTLRAGGANVLSSSSAHSVASGANLNLAGFSQTIASLSNSGMVSLGGSTPGATLTVTGPYVGNNGQLSLSTVLGGNDSATDRLVLSGATAVASGNTTVHITNASGLGAQTTGNGIEVVGTANGASLQPGAFTLAGGHVDAGAFEYRLFQTAQGASLQSSTTAPPVIPAPHTPAYRAEVPLLAAVPAQLRQADNAMLGDMRKRMGDEAAQSTVSSANSDNGHSRRIWGRILRIDPRIQQQSTVSQQSRGHMTGFQAGVDLYADQSLKAGIYVGQLDGEMGVSGFASGQQGKKVGFNKLTGRYLGVYGTWQDASGLYADAVLQAADYRSELHVGRDSSSARTKGHGWQTSLEMGKPMALSSNWQIEPQAQLIYRNLSLDDTALSLTTVKSRAEHDWTVRLGARIKGNLTTGAGLLQPYGRINVYKASSTTDVASFVTQAAVTDIASKGGYTSTEMAIGATLQLSNNTSLYGEFGKLWANGGDSRVKSGAQASIGVKVRW